MTSKNGYVFFLPVYVSMKMNDTGFGNEFCTVSSNSDDSVHVGLGRLTTMSLMTTKIFFLLSLTFTFSQESEMKAVLNGHFAISHSSFG